MKPYDAIAIIEDIDDGVLFGISTRKFLSAST